MSTADPQWFLHIGLQKTGTTYLQSILWSSLEQVRQQGVDLVPATMEHTFWLRLDTTDDYRPVSDPPEVATAIARLPAELRAAGPLALTTEETLASATDAQIARLLADPAEREVHVVLTVRDLGRQLPSAWQQSLQAGGHNTLDGYLDLLHRTEGEDVPRWAHRDAAGVLERWARHVPAERIHVVTVPPSGSPSTVLLDRFCGVLGLDPHGLNTAYVGNDNAGLGWEQAEVLRRVNRVLPKELRRREVYGEHGKRFFAGRVLAGQRGTRITVPPAYEEWCLDLGRRQIERIRTGGYDVVGSLEDLVPPPTAFAEPPELEESVVAETAVRAIAEMLELRMRPALGRAAVPQSHPHSRLGRLLRRLG